MTSTSTSLGEVVEPGAAKDATLIDIHGNEIQLATVWESKYAVIDFYRGHW